MSRRLLTNTTLAKAVFTLHAGQAALIDYHLSEHSWEKVWIRWSGFVGLDSLVWIRWSGSVGLDLS
jgi:hypothetical protein